ncbi:MAG: glycosyltransferase family 25 protein [archaeon]
MDIKNLGKIYIIHYDKLKERRAYLENRLNELGLGKYAEWVLSTDDGFTKKELSLHNGSEGALIERSRVLKEKMPSVGKIDVIMVLHHIRIFKKIAKDKDNKVSMVLEDDVILSDDFPGKLEETVEKLGRISWDICYSDKGSFLIEPKVKRDKKGKITLYKHPEKRSNTTGSYLVTPRSAEKIAKLLEGFAVAMDVEMSYIQKKNDLRVFWTIPFLTKQGSIECTYKSNVRQGSLMGLVLKFLKKVDRVSPLASRILARTLESLKTAAYKSKLMMFLKDKLKKLLGL